MKKVTFSSKKYAQKNPTKVNVISKAIKRGIKEYGETFKKLAFT